MKNKIKTFILSIIILLIGGGLGFAAEYYHSSQKTAYLVRHILPVRENNFNYKFIYPLLRYNFNDAKYYLEDKVLEKKINEYIEQQYKNNNAESISVYFSKLLDGTWSQVNEDTQYNPGSLMKVLIMMDYYRGEQLNQSVLQQNYTYTNDVNKETYSVAYATPTNLTIGQSYSVPYLLSDMIENSDDGAARLLLDNDNAAILDDIYRDLNIPAPGDKPNFTISAKDYSIFLRILYNSTYLTENNSESALSLMSKSTFKDGISAGVPSSVVVAQKFGEDIDADSNGDVTGTELHNCGIIYSGDSPYNLCIMTRAKGVVDQKQLEAIIKDISKIIYDYVSSEQGSGK